MVSNYDASAFVDPVALAKAFAFRLAIDELREDEGSTIEIVCDNPDGPPNNAIICSGDWTEYQDRRFSGETLDAVVAAALVAYRQHKQERRLGRGE